ncbi:MAG: hypothetical protein K2X39_01215 [Silvanigrellaceae bacterium]|nr:hypothetical protein [Silvanigrellaceae bacterium]
MAKKNNYLESQLYDYYFLLVERLQYFNRSQTNFRAFAILCILLMFIGIGYDLTLIKAELSLHSLLVAALICLSSCSIILLIWYMDLVIFERKIAITIFQMIECEVKDRLLPKIISSLSIFHEPWDYAHLKTFFYIGIYTIILGVLGSMFTLYLKDTNYWIAIPIASICIICFISYVLLNINNIVGENCLNKLSKDELISFNKIKNEIDVFNEFRFKNTYKAYKNLEKFENHFSEITTKYKYMTLIWLTTCFFMTVFLLLSNIINSMIHPLTSVIFSCVIGMIGLFLIWHLDLNIYTKFFAITSLEKFKIEKKLNLLDDTIKMKNVFEYDHSKIFSQ